MCSVVRARAYAPLVSDSTYGPRPPGGDHGPADYWRQRFATAAPGQLPGLVRAALAELHDIRRRRFPATSAPLDDLHDRIVDDGEGLPANEVALALRCTPTLVRRARLVDGRDPDHGRHVRADTPADMLDAGLSYRAVAAVTGIPRSTLAQHHARTR